MHTPQVITVATDTSVSFNIKSSYMLASAECSLFFPVDDIPETHTGTWYYVNRVIVPINFSVKNAGVLLMLAMVKWADSNDVNFIEENSPYRGHVMSLNQLNKFDSLFGFKLVKEPNLLIRKYRHQV